MKQLFKLLSEFEAWQDSEWTCSEYQNRYAGKEQRCANGGSSLVLRCGAWNNTPGDVRASC